MDERSGVPLCAPTIEDDEIAAVAAVLRSGWLAAGPKAAEFEAAFGRWAGAPHAVAVDSATAGLHLVLAALGTGAGDEVIVPSLTWPATVNVVELLGARAVFADVLPGTLLLDPADVARKITSRTRAVVPVHYAGAPVDLAALRGVVAGRGITLVHDAAHALGTWYGDELIGGGPEPVVFSFHPAKNITTAEGGMVTVADGELAERIRLLRFHGITRDSWSRHRGGGQVSYEVLEPGWKYTMSDLHAALGLVQLPKLARFNARRSELAGRYRELLSGLEEIRLPDVPPYPHTHAWHLYVIRLVPELLTVDRDTFVAELKELGVAAGVHYTPVHLHHYYRSRRENDPAAGCLPVTEDAAEAIVSLPLFAGMSDEQQDRVAAAVRAVAGRHRASAVTGTVR
ncbi:MULTISPECIES: DegT/DnrJ/EryC1/StrS family aminotransferase [Streptomyces]|uniref:DegT/DnrJ/EryC1/StrS family aminotransferase n=1 Tax=Streptomyces TaxID=1883 RepID=UPI00163D0A47|nr:MULTISPECIES: aminotransferase class I/II-fold pyridoxal phosphate-dependent enzyme [Streptomyces]MBC2875608.1 aminotransferase class I/II-fold pyridoxal phosphate-dependent enzyme [Streptomyces sp. TYQ1024]UBI35838.1 aminotransferase class I/II-fold pyridoxal phosphate-dependent enzyme [Streptomyces mobaraensis]UKW28432.1 aminotransferase class I/II-fold pyridoxal phosphate-dependent enzyme [Streptomyces sp. TYQ1024]